jgi:hypothetical protein
MNRPVTTVTRDGAVVIEAQADIRRSADEVFDYASDPANEPEWNIRVKRVQKLTGGPIGVGARYRIASTQGPPAISECVRFDRPGYCRPGRLAGPLGHPAAPPAGRFGGIGQHGQGERGRLAVWAGQQREPQREQITSVPLGRPFGQVLYRADTDQHGIPAVVGSRRVPGDMHMRGPAEQGCCVRATGGHGGPVNAKRAEVLVEAIGERAASGQDGDGLQALQPGDPRQHVGHQQHPHVTRTGPGPACGPVNAYSQRDRRAREHGIRAGAGVPQAQHALQAKPAWRCRAEE